MNRLEYIVPQMTGRPEYNMKLLLSTLTPSTIVPRPDKYYVFESYKLFGSLKKLTYLSKMKQ